VDPEITDQFLSSTKPDDTSLPRLAVIPDDAFDVDCIGYGDHGEGLVQMIRTVRARGSFIIGVYGRWGQGKTSMLRQIEMSLDGRGISGDPEVITVWFNPWRYAGEQFLIERDYLEKIIQFPFTLPPADEEKLRSHIREDYMADLPRARPLPRHNPGVDRHRAPQPQALHQRRGFHHVGGRAPAGGGWGRLPPRAADQDVAHRLPAARALQAAYKLSPSSVVHPGKPLGAGREEQEKTTESPEETPVDDFRENRALCEMAVTEKARKELAIGILEVDSWLKQPHVEKLKAFLRKRIRQGNGEKLNELGFTSEAAHEGRVGVRLPCRDGRRALRTGWRKRSRHLRERHGAERGREDVIAGRVAITRQRRSRDRWGFG